jgi:hypothetical protein
LNCESYPLYNSATLLLSLKASTSIYLPERKENKIEKYVEVITTPFQQVTFALLIMVDCSGWAIRGIYLWSSV